MNKKGFKRVECSIPNGIPRHVKKRHFQLLEVLIAILILVVSVMPVIHAYIRMNQTQSESVRTTQRDHLVHLAFGTIIEQLYHNKIPWTEIEEGKEEGLDKLGGTEELIRQFKHLSYECRYQLKIAPDLGKANRSHFLLILQIMVKDLTARDTVSPVYRYEVYSFHG